MESEEVLLYDGKDECYASLAFTDNTRICRFSISCIIGKKNRRTLLFIMIRDFINFFLRSLFSLGNFI